MTETRDPPEDGGDTETNKKEVGSDHDSVKKHKTSVLVPPDEFVKL